MNGSAASEVSEDRLLGGRVVLRQPAAGARAAIDPVLLAAAVPAQPNQLVLDLGCGSGAAMLCLAARVPDCRVIGLDMQRNLVRLAADNIALNGMSARASAIFGNLLRPPPRLLPSGFDHVMANPPFLERGRGTVSPNPARAVAAIEGDAQLGDWVHCALHLLRAKGTMTFIHRADRIDGLLACLEGRAGEVVVFPLWPGLAKPASRILVRARKQIAAAARLLPGLVLHENDGRFTPAAEAVLRDGAALAL
jgi:tRNA1(Val) A37 N6-methylase TrmN6